MDDLLRMEELPLGRGVCFRDMAGVVTNHDGPFLAGCCAASLHFRAMCSLLQPAPRVDDSVITRLSVCGISQGFAPARSVCVCVCLRVRWQCRHMLRRRMARCCSTSRPKSQGCK
jgi:hypothetical protein